MLKLLPPGTRKDNKNFMIRGTVNGRDVECSLWTADEALARQIMERFATELPASLPGSFNIAALERLVLSMIDMDFIEAAYIRIHRPPFNRGLNRDRSVKDRAAKRKGF